MVSGVLDVFVEIELTHIGRPKRVGISRKPPRISECKQNHSSKFLTKLVQCPKLITESTIAQELIR